MYEEWIKIQSHNLKTKTFHYENNQISNKVKFKVRYCEKRQQQFISANLVLILIKKKQKKTFIKSDISNLCNTWESTHYIWVFDT